MRKKDYMRFARMIKEADRPVEEKQFWALEMLQLFAEDSALFKKEKFLQACGLSH